MNYESIIKPPNSKQLKSGRVILQPGEDVGEHITTHREELIVVLTGTATIIIEDKNTHIQAHKTFYIAPETRHNVINNSSEVLEYLYVVSLF